MSARAPTGTGGKAASADSNGGSGGQPPPPEGKHDGAADSAAAASADGATDASLVMRGGQLKKAFAPKIPGTRKKVKAGAAGSKSAGGGKGKAKDKGPRGQDRTRPGKGPKNYTQARGLFSEGFGDGEKEKPKRVVNRMPAGGKRTDIVVKTEAVEHSGGRFGGKYGSGGGGSGGGAGGNGPGGSARSGMNVDGLHKMEPMSSSEDEGERSDDDVATLFPHTVASALPVRLPLGDGGDGAGAGKSHHDVSNFPQPEPGKADFVFLQLPTLEPDVDAMRAESGKEPAEAPADGTQGPEEEEEVTGLAKALAGKQDGLIGTLRIRASGKAEIVIGNDVYTFQKGTAVDCVQHVTTVHPDDGNMVCAGSIPADQRYLVIRDLEKAMADLKVKAEGTDPDPDMEFG
eukprot:m.355037 g.355037  ORF g.355037 m.355037 type:complete len:402 (-) comp28007_c2_seq5:141-1346(-)